MKVLIATLATVIVATFASAASADNLPTQLAKTITATWTCQDAIGQKNTKAGNVWAKHSVGYRKWQLRKWQGRLEECRVRKGVVSNLKHGLAGTPMSGSEVALEAAGRRYGISPLFMAAVAGTESSFGEAACSGNHYNVWGLSSCGSGWHVPQWGSWAEAYDFYARFLTSRWPSARTTYDFHGYAACSSCWGAKTAYWMSSRFGVGPNVRY